MKIAINEIMANVKRRKYKITPAFLKYTNIIVTKQDQVVLTFTLKDIE